MCLSIYIMQDRVKRFIQLCILAIPSSWILLSMFTDYYGFYLNQIASPGPIGCLIPQLNPFDKSIQHRIRPLIHMSCRKVQHDLTSVNASGYLHLIQNKHPSTSCRYWYLTGSLGQRYMEVDYGTAIQWDLRPVKLIGEIIEIECNQNDSIVYRNLHINFNINVDRPIANEDNSHPSVHFIVVDSLSQGAFDRYLPRTKKYIEEQMQMIRLRNHLKVGDNSMPNLMATFAGRRTYNESMELDSDFVAKPINASALPWIWKVAKDHNYITMYNDDIIHQSRGVFCYPKEKIECFDRKPSDFYLRPFHIAARRFPIRDSAKYCLGNSWMHEVILNSTKSFMKSFANKRKLSFTFLTELSHDHDFQLSLMDAQLEIFFREMHNDYWKNSIIVLMGDHGQRMSLIRSYAIGKLEERMPLVTMYFPPTYKHQHHEALDIIENNARRLTSHFDLYHTTLHIITGSITTDNFSNNGQSLFKVIPQTRTCLQAGVPEQHCCCLESVKPTETIPRQLIIQEIHRSLESSKPNKDSRIIQVSLINEVSPNDMVIHGVRSQIPDQLVKLNHDATNQIRFFTVTVYFNTYHHSERWLLEFIVSPKTIQILQRIS